MKHLFKLFIVVGIVSTLFATDNSPARAANSACFTGTAFSQIFYYIPMTLVIGDQVTASITTTIPGDEVNIVAVAKYYFNYTDHQASPMTYAFPPLIKNEPSYRLDFWDYAPRPTSAKSFTFSVSINGGCNASGPLFSDGRMNNRDGNESFAVYCMADGSVTVFTIDDQSKGHKAFTVTPAEIAAVPKNPTQNTAIMSGDGATLYRLTSGEFQVNRLELGGTGKDYKFSFSGCPITQQ